MMIPAQKKALFRKYEGVIFYSDDYPRKDKLYSFYLLLRPTVGWLKRELVHLGLEPDEAESEIFILADTLFRYFDKERSSIIPYLEKQIPWYTSKLLKSVKNKLRPAKEPLRYYDDFKYEMDEEFYWRVPGILFEERYVGKCFTRPMRYVIFTILMADDKELSVSRLACQLGIHRHIMRAKLEDIAAKCQTLNQ